MRLLSMYASGLVMLYLTPAWAARLTTTDGLNSPNMRFTASLSAMDSWKKTNLSPYFLSPSSRSCLSLTS